MQQALLAREDFYKSTKGHNPFNDPVVFLADFGIGGYTFDHPPRLRGWSGFDRRDGDGPVLIDIDRSPGLFDFSDGLATRTYDRADLTLIDLDKFDPRCPAREIFARLGQAVVHCRQDFVPPFPGAV